MKLKLFLTTIVSLSFLLAFSSCGKTQKAPTPLTQIPSEFMGPFLQVNNEGDSYILGFSVNNDNFSIYQAGYFDVGFAYDGTPTDIMSIDNGIEFNCELVPLDGRDASESVQTHIVLTQTPTGPFELQISSPQSLQEPYKSVIGTKNYYKTDGEKIEGTVPAKLGDKISMAGLIETLSPYVFEPNMMSTRNYFKNYPNAELCEDEVISQDENSHCLQYAWESDDSYMECKYWLTDDNNVLVVLLNHDSVYTLPQNLRFFKFDRKDGTMTELPTALSDNWPVGGDDEELTIRYRLNCDIDGIEAMIPQPNGEGFDVVPLKFDGQVFK